MGIKLSFSRLELYDTCPRKFYYKYIEKLEKDETHTPLLFGKAIDNALNIILLNKKNEQVIETQKAKDVFLSTMNEWTGQNELIYLKNEATGLFGDGKEVQKQVHTRLCNLGIDIIDTYVEEILPMLKKVHDVQIEKKIENEDGDVLTVIIDFIGELEDGTLVVFDNKTTGDLKNYPSTSVKKSRQLTYYTEYYEGHKAGYIALEKKLTDGKIRWKPIVDEITEEQKEQTFKFITDTVNKIKEEKFDKNEKGCYSFGKQCEYWQYCKYGKIQGLKKK